MTVANGDCISLDPRCMHNRKDKPEMSAEPEKCPHGKSAGERCYHCGPDETNAAHSTPAAPAETLGTCEGPCECYKTPHMEKYCQSRWNWRPVAAPSPQRDKLKELGIIEHISTAVADGCVCGVCEKIRELIGSAGTGEIANSAPPPQPSDPECTEDCVQKGYSDPNCLKHGQAAHPSAHEEPSERAELTDTYLNTVVQEIVAISMCGIHQPLWETRNKVRLILNDLIAEDRQARASLERRK